MCVCVLRGLGLISHPTLVCSPGLNSILGKAQGRDRPGDRSILMAALGA